MWRRSHYDQGSLTNAARDSVINETDYVDLGLACADVGRALDWGMSGRRVDVDASSNFEHRSNIRLDSVHMLYPPPSP